MTAINVVVQRDAAHMMTDGSVYLADGTLLETDMRKADTLLDGRAAVACTGPALLGEYIAAHLDVKFTSFDDLIDGAEPVIGSAFRKYASEKRANDALSTLFLIGWHERENRPAAYGIDMHTDGKKAEKVLANQPHVKNINLFKLVDVPCGATPPPTLQDYTGASYDLSTDLLSLNAEFDLLHQMEIQRRIPFDGLHYVGGNALMTSVSNIGVTQRIVHTWPEDRVGEVIKPLPINWKQWIAEKKFAGMSRLQRERMMKKAAKRTLWAA